MKDSGIGWGEAGMRGRREIASAPELTPGPGPGYLAARRGRADAASHLQRALWVPASSSATLGFVWARPGGSSFLPPSQALFRSASPKPEALDTLMPVSPQWAGQWA